jgi:hypothetical protein
MLAALGLLGKVPCDGHHGSACRHAPAAGPVERCAPGIDQVSKRLRFDFSMEVIMVRHNRFAGAMVLSAALALGLATLANAALADSKNPAGTTPTAGPAASSTLKANKPGPVKDIYCTHNTAKSKLPACGDSFKAKCAEIGGKLNDPTGNPDYGACIHDDHW